MKRAWVFLLVIGCGTSAPPADQATGVVGAWTAGPDLPVARANHCSAYLAPYVVVIGGNRADGSGGFVTTDEIDAAPLAADGTLGPWQVAGHTAGPVSECTATSDGTRLYVIDGLYDDMADNGKVYTAALDPATGTLGALAAMGDLPAGVVAISSEATVRDGELVVMHSELPDDGDATIALRSPVDALAWTSDDLGIGFRAQAEYAFTDDLAITIGGYGGDDANTVLTDVFTAPLDGSAPAAASTALPAPVAFGEAVAADDWVFVTGGRASVFGAGGTTAVYAAQLDAAGALGAWQTATPLPVARTNHDMVLAGDFLVLTGGADTGPGDATVLIARVRYPNP